MLNQVTQSIPSEDLKITEFTQDPKQLALKAEASSANSAIDFGERLKANAALNQFHFNMAPPTILANNRAQVNIFGKL
ncbi:MAG: PilN domain-containing protein [Chthoniobacteraceae bacterium]